jgi:microsomal dipeptidase-like Zn-dependent dipeptidase
MKTEIRQTTPPIRIDGLQYCNWSRTTFQQMHDAGLSAVHATIAYHESFRETVDRIVEWNWRFREHDDLIVPGRSVNDIDRARASNRTAIFFGLQNSSPIDGDLGLVEVLHALGVRFMQLTYNNQSLLACGWCEKEDSGITRMGREVIREMNRLGMVVDMSHSSERSTLEAIEVSQRPIAITHANPSSWHPSGRNKSERVLLALAMSGGLFGVSLYAHHLRNGPRTSLNDYCSMVARLAELIGVEHIGVGSDLCQNQPEGVLQWMREGRWTRPGRDEPRAEFPPQPEWFVDSLGIANLARGLGDIGFSNLEVDQILGGNWYRFMRESFASALDTTIGRKDLELPAPVTEAPAGEVSKVTK